MNSWFKHYDILSPEVHLYFRNSKRYFSYFGLIMSLVFIFCVAGLGIFFFIEFVKGEMMLVYSKDIRDLTVTGDLSNKIFFYQLRDGLGRVADPRIIQTVPILWKTQTDSNNIEFLDESYCTKEKFSDPKYDGLLNFNLSEYKYPHVYQQQKSNLTLSTTNSPNSKIFFNLYISKCNNKTGNEKCYSEEKINEYLSFSEFYLDLYIETVAIDNYRKNPMLTSVHSENLQVPWKYTVIYNYNFRKVKYESDSGIFIPKIKCYEDFGLDSFSRTTEVYPNAQQYIVDNTLMLLQFSLDNHYVDRYERSYQKIQSFAANIGGIGSVTYFFVETITLIFSQGHIILSIDKEQAPKEKKRSIQLKFQNRDSSFNSTGMNNFLKRQNCMTSLQNETQLTLNRKTLTFCEVLCYKFLKKRENCKVLRNYDLGLKKMLDIKNIINWARFNEISKYESFLSSKKSDPLPFDQFYSGCNYNSRNRSRTRGAVDPESSIHNVRTYVKNESNG